MYKKKRTEFKYLILYGLAILFIIILILGTSLDESKKLNKIERFIKDTSLFTIEVLTSPFTYLKDLNTDFKKDIANLNNPKYQSIKTENMALKAELKALKKEQAINYGPDYNRILATVTVRNISTWYNQITINKGLKDNIKPGLAVVNNQGLIGITSKVSNHYTTVDLLFNNREALIVPATIINEQGYEFGYIQGYNHQEGALVFNKINNNITIKTNDSVVTSSLSGKLPAGISIGRVMTIKRDEYGIIDKLLVEPTAKFNDLRYVSVLVPQ